MTNPAVDTQFHRQSIEEDLICPIMLDLPIDPVHAEDGRVYERAAIKKHLKSNAKSPFTGAPMGPRLTTATQHKNIIEHLIDMGVVKGELADRWKEGIQQKQDVEQLLKKARSGNVVAMENVAYRHMYGVRGFPRNIPEGFVWYEKAKQAGSTMGMAVAGYRLLLGQEEGTKAGNGRNQKRGLEYLEAAAQKECEWAAWMLGFTLADGWYGVSKDEVAAAQWLAMSASDKSGLPLAAKQRAERRLNELGNKAEF